MYYYDGNGNRVELTDGSLADRVSALEQQSAGASGAITSVANYPKLLGETDDTERIRRARDAAKESKTTLYFPAGEYLVHGTIQLFSNMTVRGETGAVIKKIACVQQNLSTAAAKGSTKIFVQDASAFTVGYDIFIGYKSWGEYSKNTCGKITDVNTAENSITFKTYHRHSSSDSYGLEAALGTDCVAAQSFAIFSTFRYDDSGDNITIENITLDGNYQANETIFYALSPIHIDPFLSGSSPNKDGKGLIVRDVTVINANADGISMQNMGETTIENCRVYTPRTHGIHPGFNIDGCHIDNCYVYGSVNGAAVYDCNNVHGLTVTGLYAKGCKSGVEGLDYESKGSTFAGCTFESCAQGIYTGASTNGSAFTGCAFTDCTIGIYAYGSKPQGHSAVTGCVFSKCGTGVKIKGAGYLAISGNYFIGNTSPIKGEVYTLEGENKTARYISIVGNTINGASSGASAEIKLDYVADSVVCGNVLTGNNAGITQVSGTTSGNIVENNVVS